MVMASVGSILAFIFPVAMLCIAVVLLCFYQYTKKRNAAYGVSRPEGNTSPVVHTVSLSGDQEEEDSYYDLFPPPYSSLEYPPPYSLFDPKLTNIWPGGAPPAYEMYPITLPLAPHLWSTPTRPPHSTPPSSPRTQHHACRTAF